MTGRRLDADDGAAGTLWSLEDTHEAHQLAAACREAEMRWQFAIGVAGEGIWDWNLETGQVFLSRPLQEMLGYADCSRAVPTTTRSSTGCAPRTGRTAGSSTAAASPRADPTGRRGA